MEDGKAVASSQWPLPAEWTVRRGLAAYLSENGFSVEDYDGAYSPVSFLGVRFKIPNPPNHRRAIMQHDLHHVATGYGTDLPGEGEISAWELRHGLARTDLYVGAIVAVLSFIGMIVAPKRTLRAFQSAASARPLFGGSLVEYDGLLQLTIGELRDRLGVPREGLAHGPRVPHGNGKGPR